MSTGCWPATIGSVSTFAWRPSTASCSCAAGRATSSEAISTFLRSRSDRRLASLAVVVVLPEPWRPTIMMTAGGVDVEVELGGLGAEHLDQGVVDDLDDHLARRDRAQDFLADRLLGDLVDEIASHRQRDVGLEQRDAHLAHRRAHVGLGERAAPAKPVEYAAEPIAQTCRTFKSPNRCPAHMGRKTQNTPADETSSASVHPLGADIDVCPIRRARRLARCASSKFNSAAACPSGLRGRDGPPARGPSGRRPSPSGRGGPRRPGHGGRCGGRRATARSRSGTRSIGRDCCICWRGPTA